MSEKRKDNRGRLLKTGESQRKDGRYQYRYNDLRGNRKCIYNEDLNNLRKQENKISKDLSDGVNSDEDITLNKLFVKYMDTRINLSLTTRANYLYMWNKFVLESKLGNMKISNIKKSDILMFYTQHSKDGMSNGTIQIFGKMIHPTLQMAVDDDFLRKNPSDRCMKDFYGTSNKKVALSILEQQTFLNYLKESKSNEKFYHLFCVMIGTACRIGEIAGLTWDDIDMKRKTISINHQVIYKKINEKSKFLISKPKTYAGNRVIPMSKEVYAHFKKLKKEFFLSRSDFELDGYKDFVFTSTNGTPIYPANINKTLNRIISQYNIKNDVKLPHISAHILRHTGCTRMAESGMDIRTLQYIMGHSKSDMTMEIYNHVDFARVEKEMEKLDAII